MQTFLPYADFEKTAKSLDYKRLGKQRVEAFQILQAIEKRNSGVTKGAWINHPCVIMWMGHEIALIRYSIAICQEWIARGYNDTMLPRFETMLAGAIAQGLSQSNPHWLGDENFHISHQSNLVKKLPEFYAPKFDVPNDLPYIWFV